MFRFRDDVIYFFQEGRDENKPYLPRQYYGADTPIKFDESDTYIGTSVSIIDGKIAIVPAAPKKIWHQSKASL
jgi:hypothetical protein